MKQPKHSSACVNQANGQPQRRPVWQIQFFRRGGKFWRQFSATILLLSSILLSPAGSMRAYALDAPDLGGPTDGSTITVDDAPPLGIPEFTWAAVAGATKYRLQVSGDLAFTSNILNITTSNTTYTPKSSSAFTDGKWFWIHLHQPAITAANGVSPNNGPLPIICRY